MFDSYCMTGSSRANPWARGYWMLCDDLPQTRGAYRSSVLPSHANFIFARKSNGESHEILTRSSALRTLLDISFYFYKCYLTINKLTIKLSIFKSKNIKLKSIKSTKKVNFRTILISNDLYGNKSVVIKKSIKPRVRSVVLICLISFAWVTRGTFSSLCPRWNIQSIVKYFSWYWDK